VKAEIKKNKVVNKIRAGEIKLLRRAKVYKGLDKIKKEDMRKD
jgi:hypothetical protein